MSDHFEQRLSKLRNLVLREHRPIDGPYPRYAVFLSVSDGDRRARVTSGTAATFEEAWSEAERALRHEMQRTKVVGQWLRADWVERVKQWTWRDLEDSLARTKRNYFRFGLALDRKLRTAFLEQELNANAMLYGGNTISHAVVNRKNFDLYARVRYPNLPAISFTADDEVFVLSTRGAFVDDHGHAFRLNPSGRNGGRRQIKSLDIAQVDALIRDASSFLAAQVQADGRFVYGYHPCFDRQIPANNTLRHALTLKHI